MLGNAYRAGLHRRAVGRCGLASGEVGVELGRYTDNGHNLAHYFRKRFPREQQDKYAAVYRKAIGLGLDPAAAAKKAAGDAIEVLDHSRDRRGHRLWYY